MNETTINTLIRTGIREPSPARISDDLIDQTKAEAINIIGQRLLAAEPEYFNKRVSISSNTNIFTIPSDCDRILRLWDLGKSVLTVSGAEDNGSGLVQITTSAAHGLSTNDIVTIHDIVGTTEANGTFKITYDDTTTFDLVGSTFANAYTSGGSCFQEDAGMQMLTRISANEATADDDSKWYLQNGYIVVDDPAYAYDLIINYRYVLSSTFATALTEFPSKFHMAVVDYCVVKLLVMPEPADKNYLDKRHSLNIHQNEWEYMLKLINDFSITKETKDLSSTTRIKKRI